MPFSRLTVVVVGILLASTLTIGGNDTVLIVSDGVICSQPDCESKRSAVRISVTSAEAERVMTDRVKSLPASVLDSGVPGIPFEFWLIAALRPYLLRVDAEFADWGFGTCVDATSARPEPSPDLCIETTMAIADERTVHIAVEVAEVVGRRVRLTQPTVRHIYIQRNNHSIPVKRLADLAERVGQPAAAWSTVDLKADITWSPLEPKPGDTVKFIFSVSNRGSQDLERADITLQIEGPDNCCEDKVFRIKREWYPEIPAGKTVTIDMPFVVPRGEFSAILVAEPFEGMRKIYDSNPADNQIDVFRVGQDLSVVRPNEGILQMLEAAGQSDASK